MHSLTVRAAHAVALTGPAGELRAAFKSYDLDRDGYITVHELKTVMLSTGEDLTDKEAQTMVDMADADGDGRVSFDEFRRFLAD